MVASANRRIRTRDQCYFDHAHYRATANCRRLGFHQRWTVLCLPTLPLKTARLNLSLNLKLSIQVFVSLQGATSATATGRETSPRQMCQVAASWTMTV